MIYYLNVTQARTMTREANKTTKLWREKVEFGEVSHIKFPDCNMIDYIERRRSYNCDIYVCMKYL